MNILSLCLIIANILSFTSSIPNIRAVWKNRYNLKGFSLTGSLMTTASIILILIYLWGMGEYICFILTLPSAIFMAFVVVTLLIRQPNIPEEEEMKIV